MSVFLRSGNYMLPAEINIVGQRIELSFGFSKDLKDEVKSMDGARWHGFDDIPRKIWSVKNNQRNLFRLSWLRYDPGDPNTPNPYAPYEKALLPFSSDRPLYPHQIEGVRHVITRHYCELAYEMGTGKSLIAMEAMEWAKKQDPKLDSDDFWFVAPAAALQQVMLDFEEWKCPFRPKFMTYEALVKVVDNWKSGQPAPRFLVLDESSKIKNPTSKRSQAALHVANAVRAEHGPKGFVVLMSGSPAPRFPADWWHQCEVACPGFLKEGTYEKFKKRLALIEMKENEGGVAYPHLLTWLDDEKKCNCCGKLENEFEHTPEAMLSETGHAYFPSKNEVAFLYDRMQGLVDVKFKKDCLKLPEKIYEIIRCKTPHSTLNAAKIIAKRSRSTIQALTLLRELSDGFQYKEEVVDSIECPNCKGEGTVQEFFDPANPEDPFDQTVLVDNIQLEQRLVGCSVCGGRCVVDQMQRETKQIPSPKEDALREILEGHDDVGRLVVYAGFSGSVDRCCQVALSMGWCVLRVDGRGWAGLAPDGVQGWAGLDRKTLYKHYRYSLDEFTKICFIGQASAAGMGLNLTASPTEVFYSNDFNFESRIQAEDRNHRPGIEKVLARTGRKQVKIIDIVNLPSDDLVIENHQKKKKLQNLSMGVLHDVFAQERKSSFGE